MHKTTAFIPLSFSLALLALGSGCATHSRRSVPSETTELRPQGPTVGAVVSQRPLRQDDTFAAAPLVEKDPSTVPLVLPAKVSVRKVNPWVDEHGQLHRDETITLIEEPTQWNPEALRNPHRSYIPFENQPVLPGTGQFSATTGPISQGVREPGVAKKSNIWEIYGAENVQILDLPEYDQGEIAEQMVHEQLGAGWMKIWDEKAGWAAVPAQQTRPINR